MHQQIDKKKIILYIFFFLILSTINNISLKNYNFSEIKKINVSGLSIQENNNIKKEIRSLNLENIFFLIEKDIYEIIENNSTVENFYVKKKYPLELDIKISKTNFLGNIYKDEKNYLIGSNGKLTFTEIIDDQLPTVFGNPDIKEFIKFKKIIEITNFEFEKISEFYFQKSERWDIKTINGVLIKFPRKNIQEAINQTYDILHSSQFSNVKIIDLRIENQVIINDK